MELGFPVGKAYLYQFIQKTILPAQQKQSNTLFFLPGTGRTSLMRYLTAYRAKVEKELDLSFGGLIWLLLDLTDEDRLKELWLKMLRDQGISNTKFNPKKTSLMQIIDILTNQLKKRALLSVLITEAGTPITLLEALRQVNPLMIDFQFGFPFEVEAEKIKNYLGGLTQFALQNIWYLPLYDLPDIKAVIQVQVDLGFAKVNSQQEAKIARLSGGYPRLIRYFLRHPDQLTIDAWQEPEVGHYFEEIWDGLAFQSQSWLFECLAKRGKISAPPSAYLINTKLVAQTKGRWVFFSPLFEQYLEFLSQVAAPVVKEKNGRIEVLGRDIETVLSSQELAAFLLLWRKKGKIVSRDQLAQAIWGKDWEEKYSDWAIDQLVKRMRTKLGDRAKQRLIKTVRAKGFLIQAE